MTEKLITFTTAVLAKEKGFNIETWTYYDEFGTLLFLNHEESEGYKNEFKESIAPSQSLLQRWLREVHNIHVEPYVILNAKPILYNYNINNVRYNGARFFKYEFALEAGLQEGLKLIKP